MAESAGNWCIIKSDPGVFTQVIRKIGAKGVQIEELWTLEDSIFINFRPVHGLIFFFKNANYDEPTGTVVTDGPSLNKIYFAKQMINNACATQAVINLLLNCQHSDLELGPELTSLKEYSMSFDPKMRGLILGNTETIRIAHNSMTNQALSEVDPKAAAKEDEAYHFIGFMPIDDHLYEFDGLREGPIDHGPIAPGQDWLDVVRPVIMKRIIMVAPDSRYTKEDIHFSLMALVSDRKMIYERQLEEVLKSQSLGKNKNAHEIEIPRLRLLIKYEEVKMARHQQELVRRRHNYMPFLSVLVNILSEEKKLKPLYEKAKKRASKKRRKKRKI